MKELNLHIKEKTREQESNVRRTYSVDDNYFDEINTQKKAYFLGWMITDGYIVNKLDTIRGLVQANSVSLKLAEKDVDVLEDFKKETNSTFPIRFVKKNIPKTPYKDKVTGIERLIIGSNQMCYRVTSAKMVQDLAKYGVVQAKTYEVGFPILLKEEFYPGFIAGVISGDGSVNVKDNHHKGKLIRINIAGNYGLLEPIKQILVKNIGFNPEKKISKAKASKCLYVIELNQTETFALYDWFNKNGVKLMKRKQEILENYIQAKLTVNR